MVRFVFVIAFVALLKSCAAEVSTLEKFLTSGFDKGETQTDQDGGRTAPSDLVQLMRRAGLQSPVSSPQLRYVAPQRQLHSNSVGERTSPTKADREGLYAHDGILYDTGHPDAYTGHQDAGHYGHDPVAYHPPAKGAAVAIKIDPIGILRLILQGIPKPLLNLNGKLFFGVELGKNVGIVKGVGHAPHYAPPAKGIVLNLG